MMAIIPWMILAASPSCGSPKAMRFPKRRATVFQPLRSRGVPCGRSERIGEGSSRSNPRPPDSAVGFAEGVWEPSVCSER